MNHTTQPADSIDESSASNRLAAWLIGIPVTMATWIFLYSNLLPFADFMLALTGYERGSHTGEAIHFFFYDTPKVMLLLVGVVFFMGIIQTFFSPERTRSLLAGKRLGMGNSMAAVLGIVTPFCSCSAVPLFIGFLSAGVPLGVTFSFLIAAPMVNEIALVLLFGMFGWQVAALYLGLGLAVAIAAGMIIGKLGMEKYLQDWVREIQAGNTIPVNQGGLHWEARFLAGWSHVREIVWKVWPYIIIGISVGALIHGYVPEDFMVSLWARMPGGRSRPRLALACPCTPMPQASSRSSRR